MNLFDITDPAKFKSAKDEEDRTRRINDRTLWPICILCNNPISPLEIGDETQTGVICLDCYVKSRNTKIQERKQL